MMRLLFYLGLILFLCSCKEDRIDRIDENYIYVWRYHLITGDSTLLKYNKPRVIERKVMGGRYKNKRIKVDLYNDGYYRNVSLNNIPYQYRRGIVEKSRDASYTNKPIIGIFREVFYPYYKVEFIKFK